MCESWRAMPSIIISRALGRNTLKSSHGTRAREEGKALEEIRMVSGEVDASDRLELLLICWA